MELNSALGLRTEVRGLADFTNSEMADAAHGLQFLKAIFGKPKPLQVSIGVSLTSRRGDYRLALRLRNRSIEHRKYAKAVFKLAKGEMDFEFTEPVHAIDGCNGGPPVTRPLAIGASVGHRNGSGTVGFFARRLSDEAVGLVSNNHVIALGDVGADNDEILHPSFCDGGSSPSNVVGNLVDVPNYPRLFNGGMKLVDCAFARLLPGTAFDPKTLREGKVLQKNGAVVETNDTVFKIGRSTELSRGFVKAFHFDRVDVEYGDRFVTFTELIEVQAAGNEPFSDPGDSGSLVYNENGEPVGLLFAETAAGGRRGLGHHYVTPLPNVLSALGVEIIA